MVLEAFFTVRVVEIWIVTVLHRYHIGWNRYVISRARSLGSATPSHVREQCDMLTLPLSTLIMT